MALFTVIPIEMRPDVVVTWERPMTVKSTPLCSHWERLPILPNGVKYNHKYELFFYCNNLPHPFLKHTAHCDVDVFLLLITNC